MDNELNEAAMLSLMDSMDRAKNLIGDLPPDVRARIFAVVENPTQETWNAAHSLMINERQFITLWQAAVRYAGYKVFTYKVEEGWPEIPSRAQLLQALDVGTKTSPFSEG